MLKGLEYETVLVKMAMAFAAAVFVVLGLIFLMGIQFSSCNPFVLIFGVSAITVLFGICSLI